MAVRYDFSSTLGAQLSIRRSTYGTSIDYYPSTYVGEDITYGSGFEINFYKRTSAKFATPSGGVPWSEPVAADQSVCSISVGLSKALNGIDVYVKPLTENLSGNNETLYNQLSPSATLGQIPAGQTQNTFSVTKEQFEQIAHYGIGLAPVVPSGSTIRSDTPINRTQTYMSYTPINPAAKGAATEISPGTYAVIVANEDTVISYRYSHAYGGYPQAFLGIVAENVESKEKVIIAKKRAVNVADGEIGSFTIPANTITAGTWDITVSAAPAASANYYDNDSDFWTTGQTVRYTVKDNPTAGGVTCDGKPVPTVSWESTSQAAWQVRFGDYDSGARAGSETSFTIPKIYADGAYPVRVRTATAAGEWSAWTETYWAAIRNVPPEGVVSLTAETVGGNVRLSWTAQQVVTDPILTSESEPLMTSGGGVILAASMIDALSDNYAVFRDGKLIAVTSEEFYVDKLGGGEYQVIAMESLYYIPSNIVDLWPEIACDMISPDGGENWIALKYTPDVKNEPEEVRTEVTYYYYAGREKPIAVNTQQKSRSKNFSYRFKRRRDAQALRALNGSEVILKTSRGERIWGIVEDMTYTDAKVVTVSFSIRETDEEEDHVEYLV